MEESKAAFDKMIKNETIRGIPLLVAANKQDLADCMGVREVKHLFENNVEVIEETVLDTITHTLRRKVPKTITETLTTTATRQVPKVVYDEV